MHNSAVCKISAYLCMFYAVFRPDLCCIYCPIMHNSISSLQKLLKTIIQLSKNNFLQILHNWRSTIHIFTTCIRLSSFMQMIYIPGQRSLPWVSTWLGRGVQLEQFDCSDTAGAASQCLELVTNYRRPLTGCPGPGQGRPSSFAQTTRAPNICSPVQAGPGCFSTSPGARILFLTHTRFFSCCFGAQGYDAGYWVILNT